jgi:hypothetical protein|eukprot:scaffold26902_cov65-Phaeocystis_antarctica.AAC.8
MCLSGPLPIGPEPRISRIDHACGRVHERQGHHRQLGDRGVRVMNSVAELCAEIVRMMNSHNRRCPRAAAPAETHQSVWVCLASGSAAAPPALQPRGRVALVRCRAHDRSLEHAGVASTHLEHFYRVGAHSARRPRGAGRLAEVRRGGRVHIVLDGTHARHLDGIQAQAPLNDALRDDTAAGTQAALQRPAAAAAVTEEEETPSNSRDGDRNGA